MKSSVSVLCLSGFIILEEAESKGNQHFDAKLVWLLWQQEPRALHHFDSFGHFS